MRLATTLFSILALSLVACGGDDGGGDDQPNLVDANDNTDPPDAPPPNITGLGSPCTPDGANPPGQGDCEAGFVCLQLDGGTGAYCTKTCVAEQGSDPVAQCDPGFTGAGLGYCFLGVDFTGDMQADQFYCGIICGDTTGTCTDCDNSCPGDYLACTAPLTDNQGNQVATGCQ